jgi:sirohydrochlorin ferrochelatase
MNLVCRIAIAPLLLLGGCHATQALVSEAGPIALAAPIDVQCVTAAVGRAPGVAFVEPDTTPKGAAYPRSLWFYGFGAHRAMLLLSGAGATAYYRNVFAIPASRQGGATLDLFEPVLAAVNRQIESDCGLALHGPMKIARSFQSIF